MKTNKKKLILGVDHGTKWVGFAMGDWQTGISWPLGVLTADNSNHIQIVEFLDDVFLHWKPIAMVAGALDKQLIAIIQKYYRLPFFLQQEDGSTNEMKAIIKTLRNQNSISKSRAKNRFVRDAGAATLIIERWFKNEQRCIL